MILAIGGAGCNMAETIMRVATIQWVKKAEYLFSDSDEERLLQLNKKGYKTLSLHVDSETFPIDILNGVEKLYILAGLGGETGGSFVEIAAKAAKSTGVRDVVIIVTLPFIFEGSEKMTRASETLKSLSEQTVKVLNNEKLIERYPDINFIDAFEYSDKEALKAIESDEV